MQRASPRQPGGVWGARRESYRFRIPTGQRYALRQFPEVRRANLCFTDCRCEGRGSRRCNVSGGRRCGCREVLTQPRSTPTESMVWRAGDSDPESMLPPTVIPQGNGDVSWSGRTAGLRGTGPRDDVIAYIDTQACRGPVRLPGFRKLLFEISGLSFPPLHPLQQAVTMLGL